MSLLRLIKWPIISAILCGCVCALLLWQSYDAEQKLRAEVNARLVVDSQRRATIIGDDIAGFDREARALAEAHEVTTYLINRALGISLRYGLQADIDTIEHLYRTNLAKRNADNRGYLRQITLLNADDSVVVSVYNDHDSKPIQIPAATEPRLAVDADQHLIIASIPLLFKGVVNGRAVVVGEASILTHNLLDLEQSSKYWEALVTDSQHELGEH